MELCLAQYWSSLGECTARLSYSFHGVVPSASQLTLHGGRCLVLRSLLTLTRSFAFALPPPFRLSTHRWLYVRWTYTRWAYIRWIYIRWGPQVRRSRR
jgi:hypothetical protein